MNQEDQSAKDKLLEAGAKLFAANGLEGTSTRDIASEAGLNLSLISYYFGGKEALYVAVIRGFAMQVKEKMDALLDQYDQVELNAQSFREAISSLVDTFVDMRIGNPNVGKIMAREKIAGMPNTKDVHEQVFLQIGNKIKSFFLKGQKLGFVNKKINPDFFMCCLSESISGYFIMAESETVGTAIVKRCYDLPDQKKEFKNQIVTLFLEGILK